MTNMIDVLADDQTDAEFVCALDMIQIAAHGEAERQWE